MESSGMSDKSSSNFSIKSQNDYEFSPEQLFQDVMGQQNCPVCIEPIADQFNSSFNSQKD
jgi:hypothetical protein